jgi:hypothetical protein
MPLFRRTRKPQRHSIAVMDSSGDRPVEWSLDDPQSVMEAERLFERIRREGGAVFKAQPGGESGGRLHSFDPREDMIAVPRIVGG